MLSQKGRYALHALIVLAQHDGEEPMMIADIAEAAGVPRKFLEQILLELRKRGILRSQRGRSGGYALAKAPRDISFAEQPVDQCRHRRWRSCPGSCYW